MERTVAGHRVLRLLARGERSRVWLAANDLVLKELTAPVPVGQPGREGEALHRAQGEHVVELLDISIGARGAVLVFPRLPRGSLADLLRQRQFLDAGEAVTVLAPIASCVARMHAAGVAVGALSPASILFRRDGAPMLTGFGAAELFDPGLPEVDLESIAGVVADRQALLAVTDAVLARTTGARGKVAMRLREDLPSTPPDQLTGRISAELFDLAAARPVRFGGDGNEKGEGTRRIVPVGEPVASETAPVGEATGRRFSDWARRVVTVGPGLIVRDVVRGRWESWSVQRKRATVAGGAASLALFVALSVVPGSEPPTITTAPPNAEAEPLGEAEIPAESEASEPFAEDPVAALRELVQLRERCFRELSVLCLDGVGEPGSSALETDRAALRAVLSGGIAPRPLPISSARLVERLGDSALVELGPTSDPASVLLLRGANGWRIRDYLAAIASDTAD